jgi:hypothetical protein
MAVAAKTKTLLRSLLPPLVTRAYRALVPPAAPPFSMKVEGNYGTWQVAVAVWGDGYQADEPVQREARITRTLLSSSPSSGPVRISPSGGGSSVKRRRWRSKAARRVRPTRACSRGLSSRAVFPTKSRRCRSSTVSPSSSRAWCCRKDNAASVRLRNQAPS